MKITSIIYVPDNQIHVHAIYNIDYTICHFLALVSSMVAQISNARPKIVIVLLELQIIQ